MPTIQRTGKVSFGDASLNVWEDGIAAARNAGGWNAAVAWEREFKRDVFARIVQQLNRLGWKVGPQHHISTDNNRRFCQKGNLKADLSISGRHIELKMFQSVNCPTRPDHEGRYEWNKEAAMPYVLRLEMERTRRRIRDYLCGVMESYEFDAVRCSIYRKPLQRTAMEDIQEIYAESSHFKGGDWDKHKAQPGMSYNLNSADGATLDHGQRVWLFDRKGRINTGTAYYNSNSMWWVVTGRYDYTNTASFELYASLPDNFRVKRNAKLRRRQLKGQLSAAIKRMDFERAARVRDLLFPKGELFVVWHEEHKAYHCANFQGYTSNVNDAGRFTAAEVRGWDSAPNKVRELEAA